MNSATNTNQIVTRSGRVLRARVVRIGKAFAWAGQIRARNGRIVAEGAPVGTEEGARRQIADLIARLDQ